MDEPSLLLKKKLDELEKLLNGSKLFIAEYFYSVRNEIDIKTEELISSLEPQEFESSSMNISTEDKTAILNSARNELLGFLASNESECLNEHDLSVAEITEQLRPVFDQLKEECQRPEGRFAQLFEQLESLTNSVRAKLLLDQTILFLESRAKSREQIRQNHLVGSLCIIDRYYNEMEVNLIKKQYDSFDLSFLGLLKNNSAINLNVPSKSFFLDDDESSFELSQNIFSIKYLVSHLKSLSKRPVLEIDDSAIRKHLEDLQDLQLTISSIKSIQRGALDQFKSLKSLDLSINNIEHLGEGIFSQLSKLTELNLNKNKLRSIKAFTFRGLVSLKKIHLNENALESLEPNSFDSSLESLQIIDLKQNNLSKVEAFYFENLKALKTLNLNNNAIATIELRSFEHLVGLVFLYLEHNQLRNVEPGTFDKLEVLKELTLSENKLTGLDSNLFEYLTGLNVLNLECNRIKSIDEYLFRHLRRLKALYLTKNQIDSLHENCFRQLVSLESLNLDSNKINSLPDNLFSSLPQLQKLCLNDNKISFISENGFKGLGTLKYLDLSSNRLRLVNQMNFFNMVNLKYLLLNENPISSILDSDGANKSSDSRILFKGLANLKYLNLRNTKLKANEREFIGKFNSKQLKIEI